MGTDVTGTALAPLTGLGGGWQPGGRGVRTDTSGAMGQTRRDLPAVSAAPDLCAKGGDSGEAKAVTGTPQGTA